MRLSLLTRPIAFFSSFGNKKVINSRNLAMINYAIWRKQRRVCVPDTHRNDLQLDTSRNGEFRSINYGWLTERSRATIDPTNLLNTRSYYDRPNATLLAAWLLYTALYNHASCYFYYFFFFVNAVRISVTFFFVRYHHTVARWNLLMPFSPH